MPQRARSKFLGSVCDVLTAFVCGGAAACALVAAGGALRSLQYVSAANGACTVLLLASLIFIVCESRKVRMRSIAAKVCRAIAARPISHATSGALLAIHTYAMLLVLGNSGRLRGPLCVAVLHCCAPLFDALVQMIGCCRRRSTGAAHASPRRGSRRSSPSLENGGFGGGGGGASGMASLSLAGAGERWSTCHVVFVLALACAWWPQRRSLVTSLAALVAAGAGACRDAVAARARESALADDLPLVGGRMPTETQVRWTAALVSTLFAALVSLGWALSCRVLFPQREGGVGADDATTLSVAEGSSATAIALAACFAAVALVARDADLEGILNGQTGGRQQRPAASAAAAAAAASSAAVAAKLRTIGLLLGIVLVHAVVHGRELPVKSPLIVALALCYTGVHLRSAARSSESLSSGRSSRLSAFGGAIGGQSASGVRCFSLCGFNSGGRTPRGGRRDRAPARRGMCCGVPCSTLAYHTRRLLAETRTDRSSCRMLTFLLLNIVVMFGELGVGLWSNSLGLVSDAGHMLFDSSALFIGLIAAYIARWPADQSFGFGYDRVELLSGFVNGLFLIVVAFSVLNESIERFYEPPHVHTDHVLPVAIVGLVMNLIGLAFFHDLAHGHSSSASHLGHVHGPNGECALASAKTSGGMNANVAGIFLHVLADTLGSVGLIVSTLLIRFYGWHLADPICATCIAVLIILATIPLLKTTGGLLLNSVPGELAPAVAEMAKQLRELRGVISVKDLRFWCHASGRPMMTVRLHAGAAANDQQILANALAIVSMVCAGSDAAIEVIKPTPPVAVSPSGTPQRRMARPSFGSPLPAAAAAAALREAAAERRSEDVLETIDLSTPRHGGGTPQSAEVYAV